MGLWDCHLSQCLAARAEPKTTGYGEQKSVTAQGTQVQQEAFLSFQGRPALGWLKDTWSVPREQPPEAKEALQGGLMKGSVHMMASAFSASPEAHFLPWGWCGAPAPDALLSSLVPSLSFPGKFAVYILVFARSQETYTQIPDLSHSHCVTFGDSLLTVQASMSSYI